MVRVRSLVFVLTALFGLALAGSAAAAPHKRRPAPAFPKFSKAFQARYHVTAKSDPDGDGLNSYNEFLARTNPVRDDSDKDGIGDGQEDGDKDGLNNLTEQAVGSSPARRDTNHNRRGDGSEDRDRDGLSNLAEQRTGNDPRDKDTDDDGVPDGEENVGRIVRFDRESGALRLWVASEGGVVSATLAEDASVVCPAMDAPLDDQQSSDDSTAGTDEVVDDTGYDVQDAPADDVPADDGIVVDDNAGDVTFDDPQFADDQIADDGTMCLDSIKRGVWFSNAEFSEDADSGELVVDLLELASN